MHNQIQVIAEHVLVRGVKPAFKMLARGEREFELLGCALPERHGARPADGTHVAADAELVEVPTIGFEARDFDVDRVAPSGRSGRGVLLDDTRELFIFGDDPFDFNVHRRHAAAFEWLGCQPRPEHHAIGRRITRGDAERKGIAAKRRVLERQALSTPAQIVAAAQAVLVARKRRRSRKEIGERGIGRGSARVRGG